MRRALLRYTLLALVIVGVAVLAVWWQWREAPANKVPRMLQEFGDLGTEGFITIPFVADRSRWDAEWDRLGPEAVPALCDALNNPRLCNRYIVARRLGEIGDSRAVGPLCEALQDKKHFQWDVDDECLRADAALALGKIGGSQATDALMGSMQDDSGRVRRYAATALGRLRDRRAFDPLIRSLCDPDWLVREEAVAALGHLGDIRAVDAIVDVLARDRLSGIQENGRRALRQLGVKSAEEP